MTYKMAVILDKTRLERIKGTALEKIVKDLYGGYLKVIELEVPDDIAQRILKEFPRARIDARGFIEETPVAFKRELAAKEEEYLPPPSLPEEAK